MLLLVINQKPLARLQASHLSSVGYPQTFCHNLKEYSHFFGEVDQNVLSSLSAIRMVLYNTAFNIVNCSDPKES